VLLDEKVGLHIALGRSEHLGGHVSPKEFLDSKNVWHQDYVFLKGIKEIIVNKGNKKTVLMKENQYTIF
ncbi:hypothetical protein HOG47_06035, partial [archaeon]|nr:hypothetical protein [archaeon]